MGSESAKRKRYDALDGLRAFSAVGILLMHVLANGHYNLDGFAFKSLIPSFTNLVYLFMIISSFSMCCGYYDKIINNEISVGKFYGRRYARIWPYFAVLCVLDLIISPSVNSLYEAFANLTLCFGLLPNSGMAVIGVGWFLGLVFVFYLIFPFFCWLLSDKRRAWFAFAASLIFNILCSVYFFNSEHVAEGYFSRGNFVYSAVFFFAGGLIFLYREKLEEFSEKYRWILLSACILAAVGYYAVTSSVPMTIAVFSLFLIYALGVKRGGGTSKPCYKIYQRNQHGNIFVTHGDFQDCGKARFNASFYFQCA